MNNAHKNARTTPHIREGLVRRMTLEGWTASAPAAAFAVSERKACKSLAHWRREEVVGLVNRTSSTTSSAEYRSSLATETAAAIRRFGNVPVTDATPILADLEPRTRREPTGRERKTTWLMRGTNDVGRGNTRNPIAGRTDTSV